MSSFLTKSSALGAEKILRLGFNFFVTVLIARYFSLSDFGVVSLGKAILSILITFASFGLIGLVSSEILKKIDDAAAITLTVFCIKTVFGLLTFLAAYIYFSLT